MQFMSGLAETGEKRASSAERRCVCRNLWLDNRRAFLQNHSSCIY